MSGEHISWRNVLGGGAAISAQHRFVAIHLNQDQPAYDFLQQRSGEERQAPRRQARDP